LPPRRDRWRVDGGAVIGKIDAEWHERRDQGNRAAARKQDRQAFLARFPEHFPLFSLVQLNARRTQMRAGEQRMLSRYAYW
jgi:hypothetical protein